MSRLQYSVRWALGGYEFLRSNRLDTLPAITDLPITWVFVLTH